VSRHREHIPEALAKAERAEEAAKADTLLGRVAELVDDAKRLQSKAEKAGDLRTAVSCVRELTRLVELMAKLTGELQPTGTVVNVGVAVQAGAPAPELSPSELLHLAELARAEAEEMLAAGSVATEGHALESVTTPLVAPANVALPEHAPETQSSVAPSVAPEHARLPEPGSPTSRFRPSIDKRESVRRDRETP
jgi:hypothetical protein